MLQRKLLKEFRIFPFFIILVYLLPVWADPVMSSDESHLLERGHVIPFSQSYVPSSELAVDEYEFDKFDLNRMRGILEMVDSIVLKDNNKVQSGYSFSESIDYFFLDMLEENEKNMENILVQLAVGGTELGLGGVAILLGGRSFLSGLSRNGMADPSKVDNSISQGSSHKLKEVRFLGYKIRIRISQEQDIVKKSLKKLLPRPGFSFFKILGGASLAFYGGLFILDVGARVYIWNVVDMDPSLYPPLALWLEKFDYWDRKYVQEIDNIPSDVR